MALALTSANSTDPRTIPHDETIEAAVIGALMFNNRLMDDIGDIVRPQDFYIGLYNRLYDTIHKMIERGQAAEPLTLRPYFETDPALAALGGVDFLIALTENRLSLASTADYARQIRDYALRRELIALGQDVADEAAESSLETPATRIMEAAEQRLFNLAETGSMDGDFRPIKLAVSLSTELAEKAYKTPGQVTGVTTGLTDLDARLGGFQNSDLIILAGRPGMGKTALATNIAYRAARAHMTKGDRSGGAIVGFFSLEMSEDQLATRIISDISEIAGDRIRRGDVRGDELQKFIEAGQDVMQTPLYIDQTPALSISAVRTRARRLKRKHGLGMIVVDYLQLLQGSGTKQGRDNRVIEVSEITRGLKAIAKELQLPVIALSQLSRGVESREDNRPQLSDLRESGSIEQDADVVLFVFREEYYVRQKEPKSAMSSTDPKEFEKYQAWQQKMGDVTGKAEVIIAKNRHGPTGSIELAFESRFARFGNLAHDHAAQPTRMNRSAPPTPPPNDDEDSPF